MGTAAGATQLRRTDDSNRGTLDLNGFTVSEPLSFEDSGAAGSTLGWGGFLANSSGTTAVVNGAVTLNKNATVTQGAITVNGGLTVNGSQTIANNGAGMLLFSTAGVSGTGSPTLTNAGTGTGMVEFGWDSDHWQHDQPARAGQRHLDAQPAGEQHVYGRCRDQEGNRGDRG